VAGFVSTASGPHHRANPVGKLFDRRCGRATVSARQHRTGRAGDHLASVAAIVLADSPLACIRCARAAFDSSNTLGRPMCARVPDALYAPLPDVPDLVRRADLLDANESTWAFRSTDSVGGIGKGHVTVLTQLGG
jgi:hypothetical protein